ncbi:MAG: hypothetical protein ABW252_15050 [Polyangiales bacterium]
MKPREIIHLIDHPEAQGATTQDEQTEILLTLLVHMFFVDRRLDDGEVALFTRILPPGEDVTGTIDRFKERPLDLDRLAALFPDSTDRDDIITLAEHAVWGDNEVDPREWDFVDQLVEKLGVVRD